MKNLFLFAGLIFMAPPAYSQVCCHKPTDATTVSVSRADFHEAHSKPKEINYQPKAVSRTISFNTLDAKGGRAFYVPADKPTTEVLVLFHEWWGINDNIKKEAERWHDKLGGKVDIYVPDMYDGQVAENAGQAMKLSAAVEDSRAKSIVDGLFAEIGLTKRIATLGWCMGAEWAFKAALMEGDKVAVTVMYFGAPRVTDEQVKKLKSDVIYINGTNDQFVAKETVDHLEQQVLATGNKFERHNYDAPHAFANPSNPDFQAKEAVAAEVEVITFLKKQMQLHD